MNLKIFLMTLFAVLFTELAELKAQNLVIQMKDGTGNAESLNSLQNLSFSSSDLLVTLINGSVENYGLSSIQKLYFDLTSQLDDQSSAKISTILISPNPAVGNISISGMPMEAGLILIIRHDGRLMFTETVESDYTTIDISKLAPGMYFIVAKGHSSKFIKL